MEGHNLTVSFRDKVQVVSEVAWLGTYSLGYTLAQVHWDLQKIVENVSPTE